MKNYIHRQDIIYLCLAILVFFAFAKWGEIETVDKPLETVATVAPTPIPTLTPEPTKPPYLRDDLPLSEELQTVLYEACMEAGIGYLGELLEKYGDLDAALTAYNAGIDTGSRTYANKVMGYVDKWRRYDG